MSIEKNQPSFALAALRRATKAETSNSSLDAQHRAKPSSDHPINTDATFDRKSEESDSGQQEEEIKAAPDPGSGQNRRHLVAEPGLEFPGVKREKWW
jgi:hypothetical protein